MSLWLGAAVAACTLTAACGGSGVQPSGATSASGEHSAAVPASSDVRLNDDFGGRQLFPADNWWNEDVSKAPVDPRSDAFLDAIGRTRGAHPDFGPPPYGIPYVGVGGTQPRMPVSFVAYGDESDAGFRGETGYPVPDAARTQPNYIEGG